MSEVREQSNKEGRLWFLGVDAEEYTGELPEARSRLCVCRDSFLMTFVTSGISLAGSRQSSIAPNAVESREAPPNTTVSVSSQRHPEQLPEVTGTSREYYESEVAQSCPTLCDPMGSTLHQAPPFMAFSRQEF